MLVRVPLFMWGRFKKESVTQFTLGRCDFARAFAIIRNRLGFGRWCGGLIIISRDDRGQYGNLESTISGSFR